MMLIDIAGGFELKYIAFLLFINKL
jgi:hypothetical protein